MPTLQEIIERKKQEKALSEPELPLGSDIPKKPIGDQNNSSLVKNIKEKKSVFRNSNIESIK